MAETAAEKAQREANEARDKAVAEALEAQETAHKAQLEAIEAEREAERQETAQRLAEVSGGKELGASTSTRTSKYELLADVSHQFTNGKDASEGYTTYVRGDSIPLTKARAAELIAAGAVKDPDAKDDAAEPGGQTEAPK